MKFPREILGSGFHQVDELGEYRYKFIENPYISVQRIINSLDSMDSFLLDENIPEFCNISCLRDTPFFLKIANTNLDIDKSPNWGRYYIIEDLGKLRYKDSFNKLREIFLHDNSKLLRKTAALALGRLENEIILPEIRKEYFTLNLNLLGEYVSILTSFKKSKLAHLYIKELVDFLVDNREENKIIPQNNTINQTIEHLSYSLLFNMPISEIINQQFQKIINNTNESDFTIRRNFLRYRRKLQQRDLILPEDFNSDSISNLAREFEDNQYPEF